MSGGSFDYLYSKEALDMDELGRMAGELEALERKGVPGAALAAAQTRALVLKYDHPLRKVWKAVEWWRSCDWGEGDVYSELAAFVKVDR